MAYNEIRGTENANYEAELGALPMTEENMREYGWVRERTCRVEREHVDVDGERMTDYSCGCFNQSGWGHNYCPQCGAKVVE